MTKTLLMYLLRYIVLTAYACFGSIVNSLLSLRLFFLDLEDLIVVLPSPLSLVLVREVSLTELPMLLMVVFLL